MGVCMLSILVSLIGLAYSIYRIDMSYSEFWLLIAPFALHLGWIVAASIVNSNVVVVNNTADDTQWLTAAIISLAVASSAGVYAASLTKPNCFVSGVVAWALGAIAFELNGHGGPEFVKISEKFPSLVTHGLSTAAAVLSVVFAIVTVLNVVGIACKQCGLRKPWVTGTQPAAQPML